MDNCYLTVSSLTPEDVAYLVTIGVLTQQQAIAILSAMK